MMYGGRRHNDIETLFSTIFSVTGFAGLSCVKVLSLLDGFTVFILLRSVALKGQESFYKAVENCWKLSASR